MAKRGVNKVIELYQRGMSIPQVSEHTGLARSTVRYHLKKAGVLRTRADGIRKAAKDGRLGSGLRGKTREFTEQHKENIRAARIAWGAENAVGYRVTPSGYYEFTAGEHKGRLVHCVLIEQRIGRRLLPDEVVHHIDGDRQNNHIDNLALLTRSGHSRLHRREERLMKKETS